MCPKIGRELLVTENSGRLNLLIKKVGLKRRQSSASQVRLLLVCVYVLLIS